MLRSKLLLLILSGALIIASCSDSGTDPDDPGNGEEPVEPQVSVNNPSDGATVEGEITFSVDGQSENGFDEARFFVGSEQIETVDSPSLPYEYTIDTRNYNNGEYEVRAELDATDQDTTVEASISVTSENYLVELQTEGFISSLSENTDATYLFISNPAGNVLREIELTSRSDGNIQLLPPRMIEGEAPSQFSITIGRQTTNSDGQQRFYLETHTGFQSWSVVSKVVEQSSSTESDELLAVNYYNYPQQYYFGYGQDARLSAYLLRPSQSDSLPVTNSSDEAMFTLVPSDEGLPQYYRETNLQDSVDDGPMEIDVTENFQEFSVESISIPSGYSPSTPQPYVQGEGSFSETYYFFIALNYPYGMDPGSDEVLIAYPDIDNRSVGYYLEVTNSSNSSIRAVERVGDQSEMPSSFSLINGEASFSSKSLDDVQMSINGSPDFAYIYAYEANAQQSDASWSVWLPDSTESFVYPKIADSLSSSVTSYNRADLVLNDVEIWDTDAWDGYSDFRNAYYGQEPYRLPFNYRFLEKQLLNNQDEISPTEKEIRIPNPKSSGRLPIPDDANSNNQ